MNSASATRILAVLIGVTALLLATGCDGEQARGQTTVTPTADGIGYQGVVDDLDLDAHKGRVVLLNFWATWCTPCRVEIPDLVRLRRDFKAEDVSIVGISLDDRSRARVGSIEELESVVQRFVTRSEINYPVYLDEKQRLAGHFSGGFMGAVPTTIVLDREGRVRGMHSGLPRARDGRIDPYGVLAREVQEILDEG